MCASWGGEPDSLCVVVGRGGGLQIRRGEATRYAGFEAPGGPVCTPVCLPRSGCWATGPELGLWGLPFACACKWNAPVAREGEGEAGPQGPSPAAGLEWECYAAASATAGGSPSTPPPCQTATLPPSPSLSSNSCSLAALSGSLAALVPDPCVARSLVSNLPGPPKPSQTSPPSAAPSFPCPPGGSTRLHAGHQGICLHRQRLAMERDEALGLAFALTNTHTREGTGKQTNEQARLTGDGRRT